MGTQVSWLVELAVKPGQLDTFRALTHEMVERTHAEPGVRSDERFVSEDGKFVHAYERYANSASALAHAEAFEKTFRRRFLAMVDRRRFTVYGTDDLREVLNRLGGMYLRPFGEFAYWA